MPTTIEEYAVISAIAKAIAPHLGKEWKFVDKKDADDQPVWFSEIHHVSGDSRIGANWDGPILHFECPYNQKDRILIRGHFGRLQEFRPYNDKAKCSITVSKDKSPDKIANAIVGRLLPEYLECYKIAAQRAKDSAENEAKKTGMIERLAKLANKKLSGGRGGLELRLSVGSPNGDDSFYGELTVCSSNSVKLVLNSLSEERAIKILKVLGEIP